MWILKAENNLWLSTHFAVCTFPTDVCWQEDHLHLGFWHILQSAVSCRCCYVCEVSWMVLSARSAEPEVCILKYWETEVCNWVKVTCLSRGLCKCCFCPLLEEFMYLQRLEGFRCSALGAEPQGWYCRNTSLPSLYCPQHCYHWLWGLQ